LGLFIAIKREWLFDNLHYSDDEEMLSKKQNVDVNNICSLKLSVFTQQRVLNAESEINIHGKESNK